MVKVDGVLKGSNCNCSGYSRPAVLELQGTRRSIQHLLLTLFIIIATLFNDAANAAAIIGAASTIEVLHRGDPVADSVQTAIGAGPNLVSIDASTGSSYVDIPSDDDNINILEHAANSAVGLVLSKSQVIPV